MYTLHIAGGQVIAKQVSEKILVGRELELYKWDGEAEELVHENPNMLRELTTSTKIKLLNIKVVDQPCQVPDIEESEIPFDPVTFSREECACNPVRYSMQRSGSGWFETLLNSHVNFTSASKNACSAAVGFKWMLNQGLMEHHNEIAEYFKRNGVSAIFLFRRNLLRRMISLIQTPMIKMLSS
ncbi:hypothetical protein Q3G72_030759 [Acer saccharum]|nr:hypothetical protein Q3G72_030759 [Acer saccharum]